MDFRVYKNELGFENLALFSEDGKYRYGLSRDWKEDGPVIVFVMLNPSIGDEKRLEQTTAGCMKRAINWNYAGMIVINLFAYIATKPEELKQIQDPVGPDNDSWIKTLVEVLPSDAKIVAAWGNHGKLYNRDREVLKLLKERDIYCLGMNMDKSPKHPLHMSHSIPLQLWRTASE
jgi:hypothetical protein